MGTLMDNLLSCELAELEERILSLGQPRFRAHQVFQWIHGKGVFQAEEMRNLPKVFRKQLADLFPPFPVSLDEQIAGEDGTRKFRFRLIDNGLIESVLIPDGKRLTLCLSTQLGCRMGCLFCRTGMMGWQRNLDAEEIIGQYYAVRSLMDQGQTITHIVLMGMGEPLDNLENTLRALRILMHPLGCALSTRRITISTVGIPENLELLVRALPVSITLSLNASNNLTRSRLMPINRRYPMETVLSTLRRLPLAPRRRYTIGYVLIKGINDSDKDARDLSRLLHGLRCKVNLIPFNSFPDMAMERPDESRVWNLWSPTPCRKPLKRLLPGRKNPPSGVLRESWEY